MFNLIIVIYDYTIFSDQHTLPCTQLVQCVNDTLFMSTDFDLFLAIIILLLFFIADKPMTMMMMRSLQNVNSRLFSSHYTDQT